MNRFEIFSAGSSLSIPGPYSNHLKMHVLCRRRFLCPTVRSTTFSNNDLETFLAPDVFFFCTFYVVWMQFSGKLGVCAATGCCFGLAAVVTWSVDAMFRTLSLSITTMFDWKWIACKVWVFRGCRLYYLSCVMPSAVLELPVNDGVPTISS